MKANQPGNRWTVPWRPTDRGDSFAANSSVPEYAASMQDVDAYQRDGVVFLKGVFTDWVAPLQDGLERNLAEPEAYAFPCDSTEQGEPGRFFDSYCNWERIPEYADYVLNSVAASMAGQFMCSNTAQLFHEHAFVKEPGTQHATPWHHDLPYYCVAGNQTVSIYVSLDDVPQEIALRFVVGSHLWNTLFHPRHFINGAHFAHQDPELERLPDIDARQQEYDIRSWSMEPGDAILFSFRTLHGTSGSLVEKRRRAFSTRWLGDDVAFCERAGETSPPYPDIGLKSGERMREDWFPVLWKRT